MTERYDHIVRDYDELRLRCVITSLVIRRRRNSGRASLSWRNVCSLQRDGGNRRDACAPQAGCPCYRKDCCRAKKLGFSDRQLAHSSRRAENEIRAQRQAAGVIPTYRLVDTCAAEFEAYTPYYYSTYGDENEIRASDKRKIMILGGGPNRIGQGIEFDYCCVHAAFALRELGFETIMVNSNPETVSTDYDTSDKLISSRSRSRTCSIFTSRKSRKA